MIRRAGWVLLPLVCLSVDARSTRPEALPSAASLTAAPHAEPVPSDLHASVAALLKPGGIRAVADDVTLDFWWSGTVPAGSGWSGVPEGTLVGAVRLSGAFRDIRGSLIKPGTYTLRYGLQPDNGDHLGVSPHRQFLLISPAADDRSPGALGHEGTVDVSKGAVGGSHPAIWSIDPPAAEAAPLTIHTTDLGHQAVIVALPSAMKFGLVLVGKIEA
ncbi:MAG TPA: hypothetical protein VE379_02835 [Vicinamibacterales bacterium]|jgi:hypothetical protein|nr:hypothetical protein [Vicinamibacterales bacterium]